MNIRFIKLSNKWFIDIPWDGNIDDLQMVCGADLLLDSISNDNFYVNISLETNNNGCSNEIILKKINEDELNTGCYYNVNSYNFKGRIWLCNVTRHVLGDFPDSIYINVL